MICNNCECEHDGSYGSGRFCSLKCARGFSTKFKRKEINKKVSLSLIGKNLKKENIKICLCGTSFKPIRSKQKFCSRICGLKFSKKTGWKNHKSVDWSHINKKAYSEGKNRISGGTSKWTTIETSNGLLKVQGSFEVRVCKILDIWKENGRITNWTYSTDRIKYIGIDEKQHTYFIDFKIFDSLGFWYLEVKGFEHPNDKLKWKEVRKMNRLDVWFKSDIEREEEYLRGPARSGCLTVTEEIVGSNPIGGALKYV